MSSNGLAISKEFNERIVESLRNSIGMMLPDDALAELVTKEFNAFLYGEQEWKVSTKQTSSYPNTYATELVTRMTPFRQVVFALIQEEFGAKMKEILSGPEFKAEILRGYHNGDGQKILTAHLTEKHDAMLKEGIPLMMANLMTNVMAVAVNQATSNLITTVQANNLQTGPIKYRPEGSEQLF